LDPVTIDWGLYPLPAILLLTRLLLVEAVLLLVEGPQGAGGQLAEEDPLLEEDHLVEEDHLLEVGDLVAEELEQKPFSLGLLYPPEQNL
jgi:hypothetical protein